MSVYIRFSNPKPLNSCTQGVEVLEVQGRLDEGHCHIRYIHVHVRTHTHTYAHIRVSKYIDESAPICTGGGGAGGAGPPRRGALSRGSTPVALFLYKRSISLSRDPFSLSSLHQKPLLTPEALSSFDRGHLMSILVRGVGGTGPPGRGALSRGSTLEALFSVPSTIQALFSILLTLEAPFLYPLASEAPFLGHQKPSPASMEGFWCHSRGR